MFNSNRPFIIIVFNLHLSFKESHVQKKNIETFNKRKLKICHRAIQVLSLFKKEMSIGKPCIPVRAVLGCHNGYVYTGKTRHSLSALGVSPSYYVM
jgi:hypothetical protein